MTLRNIILAAVVLYIGRGCKRSLVRVRNTPDWYEPDVCAFGSMEPAMVIAYFTKRGKPLKRRRIYLKEVAMSDTCSPIDPQGAYPAVFERGERCPPLQVRDHG